MASGDVVGIILDVMPPAATFATADIRAGGSSPVEDFTVWDFDDTTAEYMDFKVQLQGYDGNGLTITVIWSATSATTNAVVWGAAVRRLADDVEDIDTSQTYDYNDSAAATAPSASGENSYDNITFTSGADMDSWVDGEMAIVRIRRNPADGGDTMVGDAELWGIVIKET